MLNQLFIHLFHAGRQSAYSVVRLVTHDCTGGLTTRYPTVDIGSTNASVK